MQPACFAFGTCFTQQTLNRLFCICLVCLFVVSSNVGCREAVGRWSEICGDSAKVVTVFLTVILLHSQAESESNSMLKHTKLEIAYKQENINQLEGDKSKALEELKEALTMKEGINKLLACCEAKKETLSSHFEGLYPRAKNCFTAINLRQHIFKMLPYAICFLGYHYHNFIPTSCGHTYHPACIMALICREDVVVPWCVAYDEILHPDWLEIWGIACSSLEVDDLAIVLDLEG